MVHNCQQLLYLCSHADWKSLESLPPLPLITPVASGSIPLPPLPPPPTDTVPPPKPPPPPLPPAPPTEVNGDAVPVPLKVSLDDAGWQSKSLPYLHGILKMHHANANIVRS